MPGLQLVAQVLDSAKLEETLVVNLNFSLVLFMFHFGRPIVEGIFSVSLSVCFILLQYCMF